MENNVENEVKTSSSQEGGVNLKQCFMDAVDIYKNNISFMLLSVLVAIAIPLFIFFIAGLVNFTRDIIPYIIIIAISPLLDAYAWLLLNGKRKSDKKIEFKDINKGLKKYLILLVVRPVVGIATISGLLAFVIPGLYIGTILMFATILVIDQDLGIISSIVKSFKFVHSNGFWKNLLIFVVATLILLIPYVNILLFALPLLIVVSAYDQQK